VAHRVSGDAAARTIGRCRAARGGVPAAASASGRRRLTFCAYADITSGAVGSGTAAMSMIADIVKGEINWQLHVMRPSPSVTTTTAHRRAVKRKRSSADETEAKAPDTYCSQLPLQKRARRGPTASRGYPDYPRAAPGTGTASSAGSSSAQAKTRMEEKQLRRHYDRHFQRPPPRQVTKATIPCCLLWERLGGRNIPS